ncbi:MAG TPA: hypothetical protein VKE41_11540 [Roseiflexaceae bacterium]|nr:hypothetical protein [Roseiflexaceae bacterium]
MRFRHDHPLTRNNFCGADGANRAAHRIDKRDETIRSVAEGIDRYVESIDTLAGNNCGRADTMLTRTARIAAHGDTIVMLAGRFVTPDEGIS